VALICNLVQEFNGLVSKGSTVMLAFLLLKKNTPFLSLFLKFFPSDLSLQKAGYNIVEPS
jgi:hypothetical protein